MKPTTGPEYINWNYTYKCNFRCSHCYSRAPEYPEELSEEAYGKIVNDIIRLNVFAVGFGGGEPLFRNDIERTLSALGEAGVDTHVTTNGWFLDDALAQRLRGASVGRVLVSVDSVIPAQHDKFRNKPGSFERATDALKTSVRCELSTYISWVVNRTNIDQLDALVAMAERMGLSGVSLKLFRPAGFGYVNRAMYEVAREEVQHVHRKLAQLSTPLDIALFQSAEVEGCACGVTQLTLRPNGDVAICPYADQVIGNVSTQSLQELWLRMSYVQGAACTPCIGEQGSAWPSKSHVPVPIHPV